MRSDIGEAATAEIADLRVAHARARQEITDLRAKLAEAERELVKRRCDGVLETEASKARATALAAEVEILRKVLLPDPECPLIGPLSWLKSAIEELRDRGPTDDCEDPDAYWMMVTELRAFEESARSALRDKT